ncbi:carbohydrate phosphatase [Melanomma pulvis-pyrius CBS 109.77]|uniref:Carbohydrate phosphatase n=1 Tax=Melanomma pulvis-pyrius CBS 109.77 TaxID=1314802 RepID=A0A6A6XX91_9PLEO|nr:carbohydrate phosphatase [Melanomma pulvis-pyrius CBS 109.77]
MATPHPYSDELSLALRAIHAASLLTKSVLRSLSNHVSAETKADDSPVTIADFAAQAIIIAAVHAAYPSDTFIGEESADALRENVHLAEQVWQLVLRASSSSAPPSSDPQHEPSHEVPLTFPASKADMLDAIDLGAGTSTATGRVWVLDPVDGTATFMEGQQYAVCLCLLVDGVQQLGVIGCPNLQFDASSSALTLGGRIHEDLVDADSHGVVLSAVKGSGTYVRSMHVAELGEPRRVSLRQQTPKPLTALNFIESSLGKTSLSQAEHRAVAESLGVKDWPGTVIWSQQIKYVALTLGAADVMLRLPTDKQRYTCTWDHAGGQLLFQEAGGIIRDIEGGALDFKQGRKILGERNFGMVAAMPWCFDQVMQAVQEVLEKRVR